MTYGGQTYCCVLVCWNTSRRLLESDDIRIDDTPAIFRSFLSQHFGYSVKIINCDTLTDKIQKVCKHCLKRKPKKPTLICSVAIMGATPAEAPPLHIKINFQSQVLSWQDLHYSWYETFSLIENTGICQFLHAWFCKANHCCRNQI